MAKKPTFPAPAAPGANYTPIQQQPEQQDTEPKQQYYRFNAKMPIEYKNYLQEMAWRNRTTITDYLARIIREHMEAHPEWKDTIDILNK